MKTTLTLLFIFFVTVSYGQEAPSTIIFLRHAEKDSIGADPHLSKKGVEQAECISRLFSLEKIAGIYSTPFNRTRETVSKLSELHQVEITEYNPFNENLLTEILEKHSGEKVVVVGHSNTVPTFLNSITGTNTYKAMNENDYGKIFVAQLKKGSPPNILTLKLPCEN